jgi:carboxymethylenebutenolidase
MATIETSTVRIGGTAERPFNGFLAMPEGMEQAPAVIVLQEIFGLTPFIRDVCTRLAGEGFMALAPDLFWRSGAGLSFDGANEAELAQARETAVGLGITQMTVDSAAAVAAARAIAWCNGRVGVLGYCLGGTLAYRMATLAECDAAIAYYGTQIHAMLDLAGDIKAPLMLHVAGRDHLCPDEGRAGIRKHLEGRPGVVLLDYEDAGHAFARPGGPHHHPMHAALANARTLAFLRKHLQ